MRVKATKVGFYGGSRRRVGDVFEVPEGIKGSWFAPIGGESIPAPKAEKVKARGKARENDPATLTEITRNDEKDLAPKGAEDLI